MCLDGHVAGAMRMDKLHDGEAFSEIGMKEQRAPGPGRSGHGGPSGSGGGNDSGPKASSRGAHPDDNRPVTMNDLLSMQQSMKSDIDALMKAVRRSGAMNRNESAEALPSQMTKVIFSMVP